MPSIRLGIGIDRTQPSGVNFVQATGGTITYDGDYKIHTFLSGGTFTVTKAGLIEFLLVAGGGASGASGAGGAYVGGGGAGGGLIYQIGYNIILGNYNIVIGAGGIGTSSAAVGQRGGNSSFNLNVSIGGGGGKTYQQLGNSDGGSGGGAGGYVISSNGGTGTYLQGNNGGGNDGSIGAYANGAGGGGAGGLGQDSTNRSGYNFSAGGAGLLIDINGTLLEYAKGGKGSYGQIPTETGANNTGNGGGSGADVVGGNGGSGIFICRYKYK